MMESFWGVEAETDKYSDFLVEQVEDLNDRFGEILGRRKLQTHLVVGRNQQGNIEGSVGVEVALFDRKQVDIMSYRQSEKTLNGAMAALGPKERRLYKDSTIVELVAGLPSLGGQYEAVAVLANLCVSPASRGNGVGEKLCKEAETIVKDWGIGKIALKVEAGNTPARKLYAKLGYKEEESIENSVTLRPDFECVKFQEIPCTMLILTKTLDA
jgi:ribosomal protein S18 acetylase RimI-like enzyme